MKNIYVIGYIDSFSLACLIMDFEATPIDQTVNVVICSGGGSVTAGNAMQAFLINECKKRGSDKVFGFIIGECASIATIISTAIPKGNLKIANSATFMIHSVSVSGDDDVYQTANELREMADIMDKFNETLITQLALRAGKTTDYIRNTYFTDGKDHYLSASEAVSEGFCDDVVTMELPNAEESEIEDLKIRKFVNHEDRLRMVAVLNKSKNQNKTSKMQVEIETPENLVATPSDGQVKSLLNDLQAAQSAISVSNKAYQDVSAQLFEANQEATALRGQLANINNVHNQELSNMKAQLDYAQNQLAEVKEQGELAKFINIKAFSLNVPITEVSKFIDEQISAIQNGYIKTDSGYACKAEQNKVVAVTAEQVVEHRVNSIMAFMRPIQKPVNQGTGFNNNGVNKPFVGSSNNELDKQRANILALAARQNILYGTTRFDELCAMNGMDKF